MADLSEIAKNLAAAADAAQKASAQITDLLVKLSEIKTLFDAAAPRLTRMHKVIVEANPDLQQAATYIEEHPEEQPPPEQPQQA